MWPRSQLLQIPDTLPMPERIRRYQKNIQTMRANCAVPSAMVNSLDPVEIAAWLARTDAETARLRYIVKRLTRLPANAL